MNIIHINKNEKEGFNYGYLLRIPDNISETTLVAEMNNTGFETSDSKEILDNTYKNISNTRTALLFEELNLVYLIPLFERPTNIYTHALSRDTLTTDIKMLKRIDIQFIKMIKHAKNILKEQGIKVEEKFILNGFSASGAFSNRFAIMYPNILKGVISGGQTYAIIPEKEINNIKLTYPIGIYDLKELTNIEFDKKAYFNLPQFIYEGDQNDNNDTTKYNSSMTRKQANMIYTLFGNKPKSERLLKQIELFKKRGYNNIDFRVYKSYSHIPQIKDIKNFIEKLYT